MTPLPVLNNPVVMDATSIETTAGVPAVIIDGSHLSSSDGLDLGPATVNNTLGSGGSTIKGLEFINFTGGSGINIQPDSPGGTDTDGNTIAADVFLASGSGINIHSHDNTIDGNTIGAASQANGTGILISGSDNSIGGTTAGAANTIADNTNAGVSVTGAGDVIRGNVIYGNNSA